MENKNAKSEERTILQLMETLSEKSKDSMLGEEFWIENGAAAAELAGRLALTPKQAVLLSVCLRRGPRRVDFGDIASHLDISNIRALTYNDDINALIRAKYLKLHDAKDEDEFDVPVPVIRALKNNEMPEPPRRTGLSAAELFEFMDSFYEDLDNNAILPWDLYQELNDLFSQNKDLSFVTELNALHLERVSDFMVLTFLCHRLVNEDDDEITYGQIEDVFCSKCDYYEEKSMFREGSHPLMQQGLVEHVCDNGQANPNRIHLSGKAKSILLSDFHLRSSEAAVGGLIKPDALAEKTLFYTPKNAPQVDELHSFLKPDRYNEIRERMKANGFRSGFACLFYGAPGTGKTETVYQLARQTGRSIMTVNVPDIKSKWVGESEKNIKDVFDRYRLAVQRSELAPILLFNEADGILGIRQEGAQRAVDKMENSIQNIILQEMENMDGILIATTNLTQNLDPAFERRFLYKICFERPDASVREKIWHTMLPTLSEEQCASLASAYDLSGGQMENVARKYSINAILYGSEKGPMDILHAYCNAERLDNQTARRIGF
jgi:hypothetical protein